jgi:hypothetical protein
MTERVGSEKTLERQAIAPFFVVAAARSGTTLLRVILDRHPMIAIPGEGHFIPTLWGRRDRYGRDGRIERPERWLHDLEAHPAYRYWDLAISAVRDELSKIDDPSFGAAVDAAYSAYAASRGKRSWGDKTPDYIDHLPLLERLFPNARFVHLVRDGRDVALSTLDLARLHTHAASVGYLWSRQVREARKVGRELGPERYLEVRYEEFVDDPAPVLRRLCAFLSLPFDEAMLQHDARVVQSIPEKFRSMHTRLALPPTKGLRDWRRDMPDSEVTRFEAVAGPELVDFGYEVGSPAGSLARLRAWLDVVAFGVRLAARRLRARLRGRSRRRRRDGVGREAAGDRSGR